MRLKKQLFLLSFLLFFSVLSIATTLSETEHSNIPDSLNLKSFSSNHIALTDSVVNYGKLFLNTPYHFGSPGISSFDCSGFTSFVYRNFGYNLEHSSSDQAKQFDSIDRKQLKAGDLVFFSGSRKSKRVGHVGIVTAARENGEFDFIHAAVHKGVTISNSNEEYYTRRFVKASRVVGACPMLAKFIPKNGQATNESSAFTPVAEPAQSIKTVIPAKYHRVKKGETLSSISEEYGMSVAELKRKNNLKGSKLKLRQSLRIKDQEAVLVVQAEPTMVNNPVQVTQNEQVKADQNNTLAQASNSHTVQKGETLFSISRIYNVSVEKLKKFNNMIKEKIHPGQEIKINQQIAETKTNRQIAETKKETSAKADEVPRTATHKVIAGESLFSISKKHNIPVNELEKINNIPNGNIHAGQEIKLTRETEIRTQEVAVEKQENKLSGKIKNNEKQILYKIKKGDNLGSIAKENNLTVEELKRINNLTNSKIKPGQEIKLTRETEIKTQEVAVEKQENKLSGKIKNNEKQILYKIKKGDNLGSIAKENNLTVEELKKINNLTNSKIKPGQELRITQDIEPEKGNAVVRGKENRQDTRGVNKGNEQTYRIKKGESLISIAKDNNMSVDELMRINNLSDTKIRFGQKLKLGQSSEAPGTKTSKAESRPQPIKLKAKSGESFYTIARKYGCSVDELKGWNHKSESKIKIGEEILVYTKTKK